MNKLIWALRLGIVAFGGLLIFESLHAPKPAQPRVYVVNPAETITPQTPQAHQRIQSVQNMLTEPVAVFR